MAFPDELKTFIQQIFFGRIYQSPSTVQRHWEKSGEQDRAALATVTFYSARTLLYPHYLI